MLHIRLIDSDFVQLFGVASLYHLLGSDRAFGLLYIKRLNGVIIHSDTGARFQNHRICNSFIGLQMFSLSVAQILIEDVLHRVQLILVCLPDAEDEESESADQCD